jgi:hypothetical protein
MLKVPATSTGATQAGEESTMKRQTRLNLTALIVALPMVPVAMTIALSNFP